MKSVFKLFLCVVVFSFASAQNVFAFDYNRAINLAGKQRMLTQKMSKEVMLVALGIEKEKNLASLQQTRDLFDKTLKGLKEGDKELGLDATKKPKLVKQLEDIAALWVKFDEVVSAIIKTGNATTDQVASIAAQNLPLLEEMNKGVKFYEADAAGSGANPALAKAINLSGRQRMLTQKMSKEFYLMAYGHEKDLNQKQLKDTVALFDQTLQGLITGDSAAGLSAAPNPEIKAQLEKVQNMWSEFRKQIESVPSDQSKQAIAAQNLPLLKEMNEAVLMFEKL